MTTTHSTHNRQPAVAATVSIETQSLTLTFGASGVAPLTVALAELSPAIILQCTLHGLKQKLVDAAAISRNPDNGRAASVEDKCWAVREVAARLCGGDWNKARDGVGGGNTAGVLLRALVRLYDGRKTEKELRAFLERKTAAEKAALRKSAKIAPVIEAIKLEDLERRGGEIPESGDLLAELDDVGEDGSVVESVPATPKHKKLIIGA